VEILNLESNVQWLDLPIK